MLVQLSELKSNPAKYFDIARTADVIVTRRGRRLGRIVCEEKAAKTDRADAFNDLMEIARTMPSLPDDTAYDQAKEDKLREKGLL